VFFPLDERLSPFWQKVAELLPLLHPVRLARAAFSGEAHWPTLAWDVAYIVGLSSLLLLLAMRTAHRRLTN